MATMTLLAKQSSLTATSLATVGAYVNTATSALCFSISVANFSSVNVSIGYDMVRSVGGAELYIIRGGTVAPGAAAIIPAQVLATGGYLAACSYASSVPVHVVMSVAENST